MLRLCLRCVCVCVCKAIACLCKGVVLLLLLVVVVVVVVCVCVLDVCVCECLSVLSTKYRNHVLSKRDKAGMIPNFTTNSHHQDERIFFQIFSPLLSWCAWLSKVLSWTPPKSLKGPSHTRHVGS